MCQTSGKNPNVLWLTLKSNKKISYFIVVYLAKARPLQIKEAIRFSSSWIE
jgi:hypothetical protein